MSEDVFYTATMAKVYADQGDFERSIRIYQHLLEREPHRQELELALNEVEQKQRVQSGDSKPGLALLVEKWVRLLLRYRNLKALKKLQNTAFNKTRKYV